MTQEITSPRVSPDVAEIQFEKKRISELKGKIDREINERKLHLKKLGEEVDKKRSGLLALEKNLLQLKSELYKRKEQLDRRELELNKKNSEARNMLGEALGKDRTASEKLNRYENSRKAIDEKEDEVNKKYEKMHQDQMLTDKKLKDVVKIEDELKKELENFERKQMELQRKKDYRLDVNKLKNELARLEKELKAKMQKVDRLEDREKIIIQKIREREEKFSRKEKELQAKEAELDKQINLLLEIKTSSPSIKKTPDSEDDANILIEGCEQLIRAGEYEKAKDVYKEAKKLFGKSNGTDSEKREMHMKLMALYSDINLGLLDKRY